MLDTTVFSTPKWTFFLLGNNILSFIISYHIISGRLCNDKQPTRLLVVVAEVEQEPGEDDGEPLAGVAALGALPVPPPVARHGEHVVEALGAQELGAPVGAVVAEVAEDAQDLHSRLHLSTGRGVVALLHGLGGFHLGNGRIRQDSINIISELVKFGGFKKGLQAN